MADQVLYSGVACITDLMVKEGLINLDFADVRAIMREMGKAMMGTGEASGDKRAILAAEAAIANPLLDEVSMKGARGLLISITGGNDLTLYEVDEAASRIRQEVDEDANIILGATFDSNLDGIVRVSVVATGIDQPLGAKDLNSGESRIAEVAQKLRAQSAARQEAISRPVMTSEPAAYEAAPSAPPAQHHFVVPQNFVAPNAGYAPQAQVAGDVEIKPVAAPKGNSYAPPPAPEPARHDYHDAGPFIPPAAQQPQRPQRMPQIEDLPLPVQQQIRAQRGEQGAPEMHGGSDTKRRTLLERLASFGMSRQDEVAAAAPQRQPAAPMPAPRLPQAPMPYGQPPQHAPQGHAPQGHAPRAPQAPQGDYAKRPNLQPSPRHAGGPTDQHGRALPPARAFDDDQLEIPAFLRRQSN